MKLKLKLISLILSIVMVLSLAACGNSGVSKNVYPDNNNTKTEGSEAEEVTYKKGLINGNAYTSEFIGISCELDANWTYYSEEEIAELNDTYKDMVNDEEISDMLANGKTVYDMFALYADGSTTINISIEYLGEELGSKIDEYDYATQSVDGSKKVLESMGFEKVTSKTTTANLAGAERAAIILTGEYSGMQAYEKMICIKKGNYMALITLCCYDEDNTDALAGLFYSLS